MLIFLAFLFEKRLSFKIIVRLWSILKILNEVKLIEYFFDPFFLQKVFKLY